MNSSSTLSSPDGEFKAQSPYDLLPFGICVLDRSLKIHQWNETLSLWTGISRAEALTLDTPKVFPDLQAPRLRDRLKEVFDNAQTVVLSPSLHRFFLPIDQPGWESGKQMIQRTTIRPTSFDNTHALVIIENVTAEFEQNAHLRTERKKLMDSEIRLMEHRDALQIASQQANLATQAKSSFLTNMSHEIRTPMTAILGFAEILLETIQAPIQKSAIETIQRNGNHLLEIINDILDLSKIETGKMTAESISVSPVDLVEDVLSLMAIRADAKGVSLDCCFDGPIPETILSDPCRLRQILINVIGNAIKFTEVGNVQVKVRLVIDSNQCPFLEFNICDTGIGLTPDQICFLFEPFVQAEASTTRKFGGTGLGLSISKAMAELLGGTISATSTFGSGSTFSIRVDPGPLEGVNMVSPTSVGSSVLTSRTTNTKPSQAIALDCRVLVAEDGPDNQRLISYILKKAGADVTIAENGQVAMDLALQPSQSGKYPFEVILMDMQMPILDGYEATRRLRASGYTQPIIALTAHAMAGERQKCIDAGCDDYSTKPIDRDQLLNMISNLIRPLNIQVDDPEIIGTTN